MNLSQFPIDSNIKLSFDKAVKAGNGNIVISNGLDTRTIAANDSSQVTFSKYGDTVTINPKADLIPNTSYSIQMVGAFVDMQGHDYKSISDVSSFNFTTLDTNPQLVDSNLNDEAGFQIDSNIKLAFNEAVKAGSGNIVISNGSDTRTISINDNSQVTFSKFSDVVTINPTQDLIPNTSYSIWMDSGVLMDAEGHDFAGVSDATPLSFATIDTAPQLVGNSLMDDAKFQADSNIVLFFNETVKAGSGNIVISNGSDTRIIASNDSSQVTFSKFGGAVTINPTEDLIPNTSYSILMDSGVITDLAGNAYAGISDSNAALDFIADGEIGIIGTTVFDIGSP